MPQSRNLLGALALCSCLALAAGGVQAAGETIENQRFSLADMARADFSGDTLIDVVFQASDLNGADFSAARLERVKFQASDLQGASFRNACLIGSKFQASDLANADFTGAVLIDTDISLSDTTGARMDGMRTSGDCPAPGASTPQQAEAAAPQPSSENYTVVLRDQRFQGNDFRGRDFSGYLFENVAIQASDVSMARFLQAHFAGTNLQSSDFSGADFSGARFDDSKLQSSDFRNASFRNACFVGTRLQASDLSGADFTGAVMIDSKIETSDVRGSNIEDIRYGGECPVLQAEVRPDITTASEISAALSAGTDAAIDLTVNFATDSDRIEGSAVGQVFEIAKALKSEVLADTQVRIEGHTDSVGDSGYNEELSYRRAIAVAQALSRDYGIALTRIEVEGYGESKPIASNDTERGRALNRRVTLVNLGGN